VGGVLRVPRSDWEYRGVSGVPWRTVAHAEYVEHPEYCGTCGVVWFTVDYRGIQRSILNFAEYAEYAEFYRVCGVLQSASECTECSECRGVLQIMRSFVEYLGASGLGGVHRVRGVPWSALEYIGVVRRTTE